MTPHRDRGRGSLATRSLPPPSTRPQPVRHGASQEMPREETSNHLQTSESSSTPAVPCRFSLVPLPLTAAGRPSASVVLSLRPQSPPRGPIPHGGVGHIWLCASARQCHPLARALWFLDAAPGRGWRVCGVLTENSVQPVRAFEGTRRASVSGRGPDPGGGRSRRRSGRKKSRPGQRHTRFSPENSKGPGVRWGGFSLRRVKIVSKLENQAIMSCIHEN